MTIPVGPSGVKCVCIIMILSCWRGERPWYGMSVALRAKRALGGSSLCFFFFFFFFFLTAASCKARSFNDGFMRLQVQQLAPGTTSAALAAGGRVATFERFCNSVLLVLLLFFLCLQQLKIYSKEYSVPTEKTATKAATSKAQV